MHVAPKVETSLSSEHSLVKSFKEVCSVGCFWSSDKYIVNIKYTFKYLSAASYLNIIA